jgi:hypothetical protein
VRRWCIAPLGSNFPGGLFFTIGHRSYASENASGPFPRRLLPTRFGLSLVRSLSLRFIAIDVAQPPIGDSPKRSMKIKERSKIRSGFIQREGTPQCGSRRTSGTPLRTLKAIVPYRDTLVAGMAAAATPTHSGRYALPFFHRPHNVAAWTRATLRRASLDERPCSIHLS